MNEDVSKLLRQVRTLEAEKRRLVRERMRLRTMIRTSEPENKRLAKRKKRLDAEVTSITKSNDNLSKMFKLVRTRLASAERMAYSADVIAELRGPLWDETQKFPIGEINEMRQEYLNCVLRNDLVLVKLTERSSDMFENEYKKFLKSVSKNKPARHVRELKITQGNISKLSLNHILLMLMIRKHCKASQMILEDIFKVDQTSVSRYLSAFSTYLT